MKGLKTIIIGIFILVVGTSSAQSVINLSKQLQNDKFSVVNRDIKVYKKASGAVEMDARDSDGLAILEDIEFESGTIEIELLGENNPGKSFIGVAFNVQDNETYEAIYFRPFNFVAEEQIRKDHMVQYIFHPEFTWRKLREERTAEFEDEIPKPPNPDAWFKAIIKVSETNVDVYVNDESAPVLSVERLTTAKSKKLALWTGFGSSGRFKDLVIK